MHKIKAFAYWLKNTFSKKTENENRRTFTLMLIFGILALFASFSLTVDEFYLLKNPDAILGCSFNLVMDCSVVMHTWQAAIFGFPNMLIGLMGYSVVITIAVLGYLGVKMPRNFLIAANVGFFGGIVFSEWLYFQSVYVIEVLCPWCLLVMFSTILIFATMTRYNLRNNVFGLREELNLRVQIFLDKEYDKLIVAIWIVLLIVGIVLHFGDSLFA